MSGHIEYTHGGNPKPPSMHTVNAWVLDAWNAVSVENVRNSILSAGFADDYRAWHITKHDVYGQRFISRWENQVYVVVEIEQLEVGEEEDDLEALVVIDDDDVEAVTEEVEELDIADDE